MELLRFLSVFYPAVYQGMGRRETEIALDAWAYCFQDGRYSWEDVFRAAKRYVTGRNSRSHPTPGDLIALMDR